MKEGMEVSPATLKNFQTVQKVTALLSTSPIVDKVILFGSTVKGLANRDSDIDIIVIVSGSLHPRIQYTEDMYELLQREGYRVALHFNEFKGPRGGSIHLGVYNSVRHEEYIPEDALTEGIVLFQRGQQDMITT